MQNFTPNVQTLQVLSWTIEAQILENTDFPADSFTYYDYYDTYEYDIPIS